MRHLVKRSFSLAGHRTSVALEPDFWTALEGMALRRNLPLARLVAEHRLDEADAHDVAHALAYGLAKAAYCL